MSSRELRDPTPPPGQGEEEVGEEDPAPSQGNEGAEPGESQGFIKVREN